MYSKIIIRESDENLSGELCVPRRADGLVNGKIRFFFQIRRISRDVVSIVAFYINLLFAIFKF